MDVNTHINHCVRVYLCDSGLSAGIKIVPRSFHLFFKSSLHFCQIHRSTVLLQQPLTLSLNEHKMERNIEGESKIVGKRVGKATESEREREGEVKGKKVHTCKIMYYNQPCKILLTF